MKVSFSNIALVLVLGASYATMGASRSVQTKSQRDRSVIDSLPAPDEQEITKIRTGDEWHNPYVIVHSDGYELILCDQPRRVGHVGLDELEQILLKLPLQQWPLGKVIAVQESGLRSLGDDSKIGANLKTVRRMLESYKLRVELWPSA